MALKEHGVVHFEGWPSTNGGVGTYIVNVGAAGTLVGRKPGF